MVCPVTEHRQSLTGRVRPRLGWFRKLILQVEVHVDVIEPYPGHERKVRAYTQWRDATPADLINTIYCPAIP